MLRPKMDRRSFLLGPAVACSWTLLTPAMWPSPSLATNDGGVKGSENSGKVQIKGEPYTLEWSPTEDRFTLRDRQGKTITSGNMQPAVAVARGSSDHGPFCSPGKVASYKADGNKLTIAYEGVNEGARLTTVWRGDDNGLWLDPFTYETTVTESVVALHYFATCKESEAEPSLENNYLVLPGISESSAISPIVPPVMNLNFKGWLGHGSPTPDAMQQWGLPSDYFCGFNLISSSLNVKGAKKEGLSDAFCCGAADLPAGDLMFETRGGKHGQVVNYRGDLWGHMRGPGRFVLGCGWRWSFGPNFYEAIRHYYLDLLQAGVIEKKVNSTHKNSVLLSPQFNTWGAEVDSGKEWANYDEPLLTSIYEGLRASGMKAGTFVIDAKWEGKYGLLEHSATRFPHFQEILARIRSDGYRFGMWAAFMRCEDPAELGLTTAHMLRRPNGEPIKIKEGATEYYLFDFTQAEVQEVLRRTAKAFMKRYRPDLVKFDFGYELPSLDTGAPKDMNWAGEKLLAKGLEVVVNAMREENPDLVVMYYSLSPLFNNYFDLHSPDDLFMCGREYDLEANRRFFFSGLLGEIGMPTYGSGGYDWSTMPQIWFDSVAVGTLGSLNGFSGDEEDERATPERVAKYNGLAQALRPSNTFSIRPIGADYISPTRGARTPSWARLENNEVVLLALRHGESLEGVGPAEFEDIAQITASVVVASRTGDGIQRAARLAVVPYGDGELRIKRPGDEGKHAEIIEHSWGDRAEGKGAVAVEKDMMVIRFRERTDQGLPVEWIEVNVGDRAQQ
ncbi:MAG TPA: hypothetical protein VKO18_00995 [Terriglobia bacterium]|nr:hypothetical protein [Terriglobia bacterium]